ncbi:MAG: acyl-CoA thioesterase [Actinomycetota bacterium]|nr:acyl-CoA thioesterase [Actinomycetota bacterium]
MSRTVELDLEIYTFDIDVAGHVSNISYIRWLEIGRLRLLTEVGLPAEQLMRDGIVPVIVRTEIDYRVALTLGEPVHLSLHLVELGAARAKLSFRIASLDRVAATAVQTGIFVSAETGKPRRISPEIRVLFDPYLRRAT